MEEGRLKQLYKIAYLSFAFVITLPIGLVLTLFIGTIDKSAYVYLKSHSLMLVRCLIASSIAFCTALFFFEIIDALSTIVFTQLGNFGTDSNVSKNILLIIFSTGGIGILEFIVIAGSIFWLYQNVKEALQMLADARPIEIRKKAE